jgi:hypothetical protein
MHASISAAIAIVSEFEQQRSQDLVEILDEVLFLSGILWMAPGPLMR